MTGYSASRTLWGTISSLSGIYIFIWCSEYYDFNVFNWSNLLIFGGDVVSNPLEDRVKLSPAPLMTEEPRDKLFCKPNDNTGNYHTQRLFKALFLQLSHITCTRLTWRWWGLLQDGITEVVGVGVVSIESSFQNWAIITWQKKGRVEGTSVCLLMTLSMLYLHNLQIILY